MDKQESQIFDQLFNLCLAQLKSETATAVHNGVKENPLNIKCKQTTYDGNDKGDLDVPDLTDPDTHVDRQAQEHAHRKCTDGDEPDIRDQLAQDNIKERKYERCNDADGQGC